MKMKNRKMIETLEHLLMDCGVVLGTEPTASAVQMRLQLLSEAGLTKDQLAQVYNLVESVMFRMTAEYSPDVPACYNWERVKRVISDADELRRECRRYQD